MFTVNFNPFPILETKSLHLRRLTHSDVDGILALRSDPKTMQYIPRVLAKNTEDALAHIAMIDAKIENNEGINWAISLKSQVDFIGLIGLFRIEFENYRAELGYMILPQYHGKGIGTEAVAALLRFGFESMQLNSIEAIIDPQNFASERLLLKNGFVKEAHLRENLFFDGKFWDSITYTILKSDFKNIENK